MNASFTVIQISGEYLWLEREDNKKLELAGGGYDLEEGDHRIVSAREIEEETKVKVKPLELQLAAMLVQQLHSTESKKYGGIQKSLVFVHSCVLFKKPRIQLSHDHTGYKLLSYKQILQNWKKISSGPLWMFFAYLEFQKTGILQEGILKERKFWQGKEYTSP